MNLTFLPRRKEYIKIILFRTIGNFLILISLLLILKTFGPALYQETIYLIRTSRGAKTIVATPNKSADTTPIQKPPNAFVALLNKFNTNEEVLTPPDTQFSIIIPKIGATSKVVSNVNSADYNEYIASLKEGVAHTRGTAFPGDGGHIYLFAHSTDSIFNIGLYNAVFYLLYKLEQNDSIYIFYQGKKYAYKVIDKKIVDPSEVSYLTRQSNKEFLTMQTCWPPGTTLKRLLVFAVPVVE